MVRHWTRHLTTENNPQARSRMKRSRVINAIGAVMTGTVLVIVLLTKFTQGAYYRHRGDGRALRADEAIRRHYDRVRDETARRRGRHRAQLLPSRVQAIVLVSKLHKPTLRALAFAKASRPTILEALTVDVDPDETEPLVGQWDRRDIPVPLKVLASPVPRGHQPDPRLRASIRCGNPRDVVTVYIPEYVVGHWWEQILHNQSALRLKGRLLFTPGVMVTSVPVPPGLRRRPRSGSTATVVGDVRRGEG